MYISIVRIKNKEYYNWFALMVLPHHVLLHGVAHLMGLITHLCPVHQLIKTDGGALDTPLQ